MEQTEIKQRIESYRPYWWHRFVLPDGTEIKRDDSFAGTGRENPYYPENVWELVKDQVPQDLTGLKVLDIGSNAGWYSIRFCQMGADVTGIDICQDNINRAEQGRFIADLMLDGRQRKRIHFMNGDFLDLNEDDKPLPKVGEFDIVWFFGVYYHLPEHLKAFPKIVSLLEQGGVLFLESAIELKIREIPHGPGVSMSETHFVPTREYLEEDLMNNGFEVVWVKEQNRGYAGHRIMIKAIKK